LVRNKLIDCVSYLRFPDVVEGTVAHVWRAAADSYKKRGFYPLAITRPRIAMLQTGK
jgi:hypothetical protein